MTEAEAGAEDLAGKLKLWRREAEAETASYPGLSQTDIPLHGNIPYLAMNIYLDGLHRCRKIGKIGGGARRATHGRRQYVNRYIVLYFYGGEIM